VNRHARIGRCGVISPLVVVHAERNQKEVAICS
jgi:hypothetical protein